MATKYLNKFRNESLRLPNHDYGATCTYFVTIGTSKMKNYFGEIIPARTDFDHFGKIIPARTDLDHFGKIIPARMDLDHFGDNIPARTDLDHFCDNIPARTGHDPSLRETEIGTIARNFWMEIPQHFHFAELDAFILMPNHLHGIITLNLPWKDHFDYNKFGPQKNNLSAVIGGYKASVKRFANNHNIEFAWLARYHERIIWTPEQLQIVQHYIQQNPIKWLDEKTSIK